MILHPTSTAERLLCRICKVHYTPSSQETCATAADHADNTHTGPTRQHDELRRTDICRDSYELILLYKVVEIRRSGLKGSSSVVVGHEAKVGIVNKMRLEVHLTRSTWISFAGSKRTNEIAESGRAPVMSGTTWLSHIVCYTRLIPGICYTARFAPHARHSPTYSAL